MATKQVWDVLSVSGPEEDHPLLGHYSHQSSPLPCPKLLCSSQKGSGAGLGTVPPQWGKKHSCSPKWLHPQHVEKSSWYASGTLTHDSWLPEFFTSKGSKHAPRPSWDEDEPSMPHMLPWAAGCFPFPEQVAPQSCLSCHLPLFPGLATSPP